MTNSQLVHILKSSVTKGILETKPSANLESTSCCIQCHSQKGNNPTLIYCLQCVHGSPHFRPEIRTRFASLEDSLPFQACPRVAACLFRPARVASRALPLTRVVRGWCRALSSAFLIRPPPLAVCHLPQAVQTSALCFLCFRASFASCILPVEDRHLSTVAVLLFDSVLISSPGGCPVVLAISTSMRHPLYHGHHQLPCISPMSLISLSGHVQGFFYSRGPHFRAFFRRSSFPRHTSSQPLPFYSSILFSFLGPALSLGSQLVLTISMPTPGFYIPLLISCGLFLYLWLRFHSPVVYGCSPTHGDRVVLALSFTVHPSPAALLSAHPSRGQPLFPPWQAPFTPHIAAPDADQHIELGSCAGAPG